MRTSHQSTCVFCWLTPAWRFFKLRALYVHLKLVHCDPIWYQKLSVEIFALLNYNSHFTSQPVVHCDSNLYVPEAQGVWWEPPIHQDAETKYATVGAGRCDCYTRPATVGWGCVASSFELLVELNDYGVSLVWQPLHAENIAVVAQERSVPRIIRAPKQRTTKDSWSTITEIFHFEICER